MKLNLSVAGAAVVMFVAGAAVGQQVAPAKILTPQEAQAAKPAKATEPAKALYDENADAKQQIAAAVARAKKENKRVLVQWGGNWCGWCIRLHELYKADKDISKKLQYEYEVVFVDAGKPAGKNIDLASSYGADLKAHGFPFLTVLDGEGKPAANQETAALEVKNEKGESAGLKAGHDAKAVMKFLTDHQATPLDAAGVLEAAQSEASKGGKLVFLHFGAPWCHWCHVLEGWMAKPEPAAMLAKYFVDCKIDEDRMTGGKALKEKYIGDEKTGIPLFFFLDSGGTVVASSIAPASDTIPGNIGYPGGDAEEPHFRRMLAAAKVSAADIEHLVGSARLPKK